MQTPVISNQSIVSSVDEPLQWQFWVDRGGTFTDLVAVKPSGQMTSYKLLSENPEHYADAAIEGIRRLMAQAPDEGRQISQVKMGTTVATNALLERKGEPVFLMITAGLLDQLAIGYQTRPDIFAVNIDKAQPFYSSVAGVPERIRADGTVERHLDELGVRIQLQAARDSGYRAVAIVLMHSYRYPDHERRVGEIAREIGFEQISLSHQTSPLIKLVPRGQTSVLDAYLTPVLHHYIEQVQRELHSLDPAAQLQFMQSNGGLTLAEEFIGRDAVLSGPAGGVVGMVKTAQADGYERLIGFDMGGTSTDVSHYAGELERETETEIAGIRLRAPMMNIHTVAAGGGSIVHFSDGRLQVGPESAGAFPGPACYRNGGPLTVTDCNLLLGKIQPSLFPSLFGPEQNLPLDKERVRVAFSELAVEVSNQTGHEYSPESLAEAFLTIAVDNMASAAKKISVQRGFDVRNYALCAFGGAGAQHACLVAEALSMQKIYLHPMAGVLSAFGIGLADRRWVGEQAFECQLNPDEVSQDAELTCTLNRAFEDLQQKSPLLVEAGRKSNHRVYLCYLGSDTQLLVNFASMKAMQARFEQQHQQLFGFVQPETPILIQAIQLEHYCVGTEFPAVNGSPSESSVENNEHVDMYLAGNWMSVPVCHRQDLHPGYQVNGPMLVAEANSTIVIEPGWSCRVLDSGALILEGQGSKTEVLTLAHRSHPDPMQLEIFNHLFMSVAEQMGLVLERTATSVNIKERLDFSCALFDCKGDLVANAPHIPVHLGSMSESVQVVMNIHPDLGPDDAVVLNTPYNGGTHLPDVTVVRPVFIQREDDSATGVQEKSSPDFYVAARGHHADIGGITPGSMPAESQVIEEEGVLLDSILLVKNGVFQQEAIVSALESAAWPARNPEQNVADLKAQLASCEKGALELQKLAVQFGVDQLHDYMSFVQDNAEQTLKNCLANLPSGRFETRMDDGSIVKVSVEVDQSACTAVVDFSGTGYRPNQGMHPGNFNAPESVVKAAVLYSFRVLVDKPIPLNAGFFRPLTIRIPKESMISPAYPAAVVSGNVETAQYLVDTLMGALGVMANCQGTNNNFTFGNAEYQYYETLCGGIGASSNGDGASGVHAHMTNSRLTDPEILESRYPVVLDHFQYRSGSGGSGCYVGGEGIERHIRFLAPMTANIISGHRLVPPAGISGGNSAEQGHNFVMRSDVTNSNDDPILKNPGKTSLMLEFLEGCARVELNIGDVFCIHTPGGGGYGSVDGT